MQSAGAGELHVVLPGHPASRQEVADHEVGLRDVPSPVSIAEPPGTADEGISPGYRLPVGREEATL